MKVWRAAPVSRIGRGACGRALIRGGIPGSSFSQFRTVSSDQEVGAGPERQRLLLPARAARAIASKSSRLRPAPRATQVSGESTMAT